MPKTASKADDTTAANDPKAFRENKNPKHIIVVKETDMTFDMQERVSELFSSSREPHIFRSKDLLSDKKVFEICAWGLEKYCPTGRPQAECAQVVSFKNPNYWSNLC